MLEQYSQSSREGEVFHEYCLNYSKAINYLEILRKNDKFCEFERVLLSFFTYMSINFIMSMQKLTHLVSVIKPFALFSVVRVGCKVSSSADDRSAHITDAALYQATVAPAEHHQVHGEPGGEAAARSLAAEAPDLAQ